MTVTIPDSSFPTPATLNQLDCISASRYLERVDESVSVVQVCQDAYNPALVILTFSLVGAFQFTPYCKILEVDGDQSYELNDVTAPIAIGHYRNADIPINTECRTISPEVVFDFGRVIPKFLSAQRIKFLVGMIGTVPISFGVNFPPQTPTTTYLWTKGILPRPISLSYRNNSMVISFQYDGTKDCSCSIQCVEPSGVTFPITFCPNEAQTISVSAFLTGDPFSLTATLADGVGNTSSLIINSVINVVPAAPQVSSYEDPNRVEISISSLSHNGIEIKDCNYQILKYSSTLGNLVVWKDWSERPSLFFVDRDVLPGKTYGYAVRYKGKYGDVSDISSWSTATI